MSLHALLAESDMILFRMHKNCNIFLSTLSLRRATQISRPIGGQVTVFLSTLSLRRATYKLWHNSFKHLYFYPRSPCGERLQKPHLAKLYKDFYPRSPCGERPSPFPFRPSSSFYFYPRSPCGERLIKSSYWSASPNFYPRSPCGERPSPGNIIS